MGNADKSELDAGREASPRPRKRGPAHLTEDHKAALAAGREAARHVRAYLDALESERLRPGPPRSSDDVDKELKTVEQALRSAKGLSRLQLATRRIRLNEELDLATTTLNLADLRANFVRHAASYARRKRIPAQAFRDIGVPAKDVSDAGIE